jgi:hypothetical protein
VTSVAVTSVAAISVAAISAAVTSVAVISARHESGFGEDSFLEGRIASMEAAFKMQFAAMDSLDVTKEPESGPAR